MVPDNFSALYDAAMDSRRELFDAMALLKGKEGINFIAANRLCLLNVGATVNYTVHIIPAHDADSISLRAYEGAQDRDCTVEEIKLVTAKAIAMMQKWTRKGRIAELEEQLAELKEEEGK